MNRKAKRYTIIIILLAVIVFIAFRLLAGKNQVIEIKTEKVGRANINNTVTAVGTMEASVTVEVGTQVSGKINKLYADYNSRVKKGQLIALIDTETLESTLESSKAALDMAQAEYEYQKAGYARNKTLFEKKLIAQKEFDEAEYSYKSSRANLNAAKAKYNKDRTNLNYAYIYSPIDGIVLGKNVEEGETVAASFATPTLFTIANDLTQMEIEADVDEADIGQVKVGQRVEFTVDAFPDMTFNGKVIEIHLEPVENANVITYTVIIDAPNPKEILMPGMTANITFYVTEKKNIVVVPNRAFEFVPDISLLKAYQEMHPEIKVQIPSGNPPRKSGPVKTLWIKEQNTIFPKKIKVGETDEIYYEVLSGIEEGTEVIVSISSQLSEGRNTDSNGEKESGRSPFMPKPPGRNRK